MGSATATKLAEWGLKPALVPAEFRAEGLLAAFPQNLVGTRILFPRAEVARELLPEELRARGACRKSPVSRFFRGGKSGRSATEKFLYGKRPAWNGWFRLRYLATAINYCRMQ